MHVELTILRIAAACLAADVVIWLFDVLVVVALAGVATALLGRSWSWRVPGASFALGVAAQIPFNRAVDPSDIEETLGLAGYVLLLAALGMTVVAAGRGEVPYFLAIWAVATFGYAVGGFLDSNWASRYSPIDRCFEESSAGTSATKQIWPPGVRCAGNRDEDFVGANVVDGLIPAGLLGRTGPLRQFPAAWRDFPAVGPRRRTMTVTATV